MAQARELAKRFGNLLEASEITAALEIALALAPWRLLTEVAETIGAITEAEISTRMSCVICIADYKRGRLKKAKRPGNQCNNCGAKGTTHRCEQPKHDFDVCQACWDIGSGAPLANAVIRSVRRQFESF